MKAAPLDERVLKHVLIDDNGCWLWQSTIMENGYGTIHIKGHTRRAHRVSYEVFVGPIPEGLVIDHLCRVKRCVNPEHLEAVTNAENVRRGHLPNRDKTHCPQGHPYSGDNVYVERGSRKCRECYRVKERRRTVRRREQRVAQRAAAAATLEDVA